MAVSVKSLKVYYQTLRGQVQAVDNVSFDIKEHEILGMAGESGCGKSTFSNSLVLLKPPMKHVGGQVELDGETLPLSDFKKMNRFRYTKVSIIPQYAMNALNPTRKIGRMIAELLESRGMSIARVSKELDRRLKLVNLDRAVMKMYPFELSGGMRQRTVMVIATLLNPSLLLADEITSALDVSTQKAVAKMLVQFRDNNLVKSVVFVTHDISILYQIADSILIMYAGKIVEIASTESITREPLHPYTRLLISSLPDVGVKYTDRRLAGIKGRPPSLLNPLPGCRFKERCPVRFDKCDEEPPLEKISEQHQVACWREVKVDG